MKLRKADIVLRSRIKRILVKKYGVDDDTATEIASFIFIKLRTSGNYQKMKATYSAHVENIVDGLYPIWRLVKRGRMPRYNELNAWSFKLCREEIQTLKNPRSLLARCVQHIPQLKDVDAQAKVLVQYDTFEKWLKARGKTIKARPMLGAIISYEFGVPMKFSCNVLGISVQSLRPYYRLYAEMIGERE